MKKNALLSSISPSLFEESLQHVHTGVIWYTTNGKVCYFNEKARMTLGYSIDEMEELTIFDIHPNQSKLSFRKLIKQLEQEQSFEEETEQFSNKDILIPARVHYILHQVAQESILITLISGLLEQQKSRKLLEMATQQEEIGLFEWNLLKKQLATNEQFDKMIGLARDQRKSLKQVLQTFQQWLKAPDYQKLVENIRLALKDADSFNMVVQSNSDQFDRPKWVMLKAKPILNNEEMISLSGTLTDITVRKERMLHRKLADTTIDAIDHMIIWIKPEGEIIHFNEAIHKHLGYSAEELEGTPLQQIIPRLFPDFISQIWKEPDLTQTPNMETYAIVKEGGELPLLMSLNFLEEENDLFICVVAQNNTQRKEREKKLQEAQDEVQKLKEKLEAENTYLQSEISLEYNFNNIISTSKRYKKVLKQTEQVASTDATVLILGETGTGKELLARAIHKMSHRDERPLVKVNCAALPENLIESELFGHEKGAFTGAFSQKIGRFELADRGTIFLDEIGELPLDLQAKLLRVLQEGEFERLGSTKTLSVDVRVIAATNRNLEELAHEGKFREDLFYRLNVFPIQNLPLRERREDIPLLVQHFIVKYSDKMGKKIEGISQSAHDQLMKYDFPGNIRELENLIERAVILSQSNTLKINLKERKQRKSDSNRFKTFDQMQRDHIVEALQKTNWKVSGELGAAELLGLNHKTLSSKMRKFDINRRDFMDI